MTPRVLLAWLGVLLAAGAPAGAEGLPLEVRSDRPGLVELRWQPTPAATGYELWRKLEPKGEWHRLGTGPAGMSRYVDRATVARAFYSYKLTVLGTGAERQAGPVEALARFYVEVRGHQGERAALVLHVWDDALGEWIRSDEVEVAVGQRIRTEQGRVATDTGATLREVSPDPVHGDATRVLFASTGEPPVEVTSRDALPTAVADGGRAERRGGDEAASKERGPEDGAEAPTEPPADPALQFPEPKRVGTVVGGRVVWEIENQSEHRLHLVITGRVGRTFSIGPGKTFDVRLPGGGDYEVVANASDNAVRPLRGQFGLESGVRYKSVLGIR